MPHKILFGFLKEQFSQTFLKEPFLSHLWVLYGPIQPKRFFYGIGWPLHFKMLLTGFHRAMFGNYAIRFGLFDGQGLQVFWKRTCGALEGGNLMRKLYPPKMSLIHHSKAFLWVQRTVEVFLKYDYMIHESTHIVIFMSVRERTWPWNELTKKNLFSHSAKCDCHFLSQCFLCLFTDETSKGVYLKYWALNQEWLPFHTHTSNDKFRHSLLCSYAIVTPKTLQCIRGHTLRCKMTPSDCALANYLENNRTQQCEMNALTKLLCIPSSLQSLSVSNVKSLRYSETGSRTGALLDESLWIHTEPRAGIRTMWLQERHGEFLFNSCEQLTPTTLVQVQPGSETCWYSSRHLVCGDAEALKACYNASVAFCVKGLHRSHFQSKEKLENQ